MKQGSCINLKLFSVVVVVVVVVEVHSHFPGRLASAELRFYAILAHPCALSYLLPW
jgi:hypothetical protein